MISEEADAVQTLEYNGGNLTRFSEIGIDPLALEPNKPFSTT